MANQDIDIVNLYTSGQYDMDSFLGRLEAKRELQPNVYGQLDDYRKRVEASQDLANVLKTGETTDRIGFTGQPIAPIDYNKPININDFGLEVKPKEPSNMRMVGNSLAYFAQLPQNVLGGAATVYGTTIGTAINADVDRTHWEDLNDPDTEALSKLYKQYQDAGGTKEAKQRFFDVANKYDIPDDKVNTYFRFTGNDPQSRLAPLAVQVIEDKLPAEQFYKLAGQKGFSKLDADIVLGRFKVGEAFIKGGDLIDDEVSSIDLGYDPDIATTAKDVREAEGFFDTALTASQLFLENAAQGLGSIVLAKKNPQLMYTSIFGNIATENATNSGEYQVTAENLANASWAAGLSMALDRTGLKAIGGGKGVLGAVGSGGVEAITEGAQEGIEYLGGITNTGKEIDYTEMGDAALTGAIVGGGTGFSVNAAGQYLGRDRTPPIIPTPAEQDAIDTDIQDPNNIPPIDPNSPSNPPIITNGIDPTVSNTAPQVSNINANTPLLGTYSPEQIVALEAQNPRLAKQVANLQATLANPNITPQQKTQVEALLQKTIDNNDLIGLVGMPRNSTSTPTSRTRVNDQVDLSSLPAQNTTNEITAEQQRANILQRKQLLDQQLTEADERIRINSTPLSTGSTSEEVQAQSLITPQTEQIDNVPTDATPTTVIPTTEAQPIGTEEVVGNQSKVRTMKQNLNTRFKVVEADSLNPVEATDLNIDLGVDDKGQQQRDRKRGASKLQVEQISNGLQPFMLFDDTGLQGGSPTVAKDGTSIVAGNGRTLAIKKTYERGRGANYRSELIANAEQYGLDPAQIAKMKFPVFVRQLEDDVDIEKVAIASNEEGALGHSSMEQAGIDAKRLPSLDRINVNDGEINIPANRSMFQQFVSSMPIEASASLITKNGMLSQEGLRRVENAILYKAYGKSPALEEMIESTNPTLKNALKAMVNASPTIVKTKDSIEQGTAYDLDISKQVSDALTKLIEIKANPNLTVEQYLSQFELEESLDDVAKSLISYIDDNARSAKAITELLVEYYNQVEILGNPQEANLFESPPLPTRQQIIDGIINKAETNEQTTAGTTESRTEQEPVDTRGGEQKSASEYTGRRTEQSDSQSSDEASTTEDTTVVDDVPLVDVPSDDIRYSQRTTPNQTTTDQDADSAQTAIEDALGKTVANSITIKTTSSPEMAGVEGYHNRTTGETVVLLDNIEPMYDVDGNVIMTREERAVWVAWHENYHKGTSVAGNVAYRKTLALARQNPFISALVEKIQLANPDYSLDVATEEALAELSAGLSTDRLDVIAKQYGIATPKYDGISAIVKKWINEIRNILRRLTGKPLIVSDAQIADLVRSVSDLAVNEGVGNADIQTNVVIEGETANLYSLNESEDSDFANAIDDIYSNDKKRVSSEWIELGTTPEALISSGIDDKKIFINKNKMAKIRNDHPEISASMMKRIPVELNNPVAVFKNTKKGSVDNSYVILTEIQTDDGDAVIIPLHAYQSQGGLVVHKVASMYGRNESERYIKSMVQFSEVRYADKQKARRVQRRLQLLEANTVDELLDKAIVLKDDGDVNEQSEVDTVRKQYEGTDQWLKAPNGNDTNLSKKQWLQVRTTAFKNWFGDWQNNPSEASKVVDDNGEPLVVYHGTSNAGFNEFDIYSSNFGLFGQGAYFTDNKSVAESYTEKGQGNTPDVYNAFLNIRNPIDMDAKASEDEARMWQETWVSGDDITNYFEGNVDSSNATNEQWFKALNESFKANNVYDYEAIDSIAGLYRKWKVNGITHIGGGRFNKSDNTRHKVWIATEADEAQIKSATDNNGDYSSTNRDIRFSKLIANDSNTITQSEYFKNVGRSIEQAVGKDNADLIDLVTDTVETKDTAGYFDPRTGKTVILLDNIKPLIDKNGDVVLNHKESVIWVAWHELFHRGMEVAGFNTYMETIISAGKNPFIKELSEKMLKQQPELSSMVSIEEALAETRAALSMGRMDSLKAEYGINTPQVKGLRSVLNKWYQSLRNILRTITGRNVDLPDHKLIELINSVTINEAAAIDGEFNDIRYSRQPQRPITTLVPQKTRLREEVRAVLNDEGLIAAGQILADRNQVIKLLKEGHPIEAFNEWYNNTSSGKYFNDKVFDAMGELDRLSKKFGGLATEMHNKFKMVNAKIQEELRASVEPAMEKLSVKLADKFKELRELDIYPEYKDKYGKAQFLFDLDQIGKYVKHGKERNLQVLINTNGEQLDGSGKSDAEIDELINYYNQRPELIEFYEQIYKDDIRPMINYRNDQLIEAGILTDEMIAGQYDWEWYVPLKGKGSDAQYDPITDELITDGVTETVINNAIREGKGFRGNLQSSLLNNNEIKKMTGRHGTEAESIFGTIFSDAQSAVQRNRMQEAKKALFDYANTDEGRKALNAEVEPDKDGKQFSVDPNTGNLVFTPNTIAKDENTVVYQNGNEVYRIRVGNPRAMEAMGSVTHTFGDGAWGNVGRGFNRLTRTISSVWTRFSLAFQVVNKLRDAFQHYVLVLTDAPVTTKGNNYKEAFGNLGVRLKAANLAAKNNIRYTASLASKITGDGNATYQEYEQYLEILRKEGGVTTYSQLLGTDKLKSLEREFSKGVGDDDALRKRLADGAVEFFDGVNDNIELSSRVALLKALMDSGVSQSDAALYVKDTMNFETKGEVGKVLGAFYAFSTAIIYDSKRTASAIFTNKEGHIVFAMLVLAKLIEMGMADLLGEDDEDGIAYIDKQPFYQAMGYTNYVFGERGEGIKIPKGWGTERVASGVAVIGRRLANGRMDAGEAMHKMMFDVILGNFSPVQIKSVEGDRLNQFLQTGLPTALVPLYQIDTNKSFTGSHLRPIDEFQKAEYLDYESSYDWTEDTYKSMAKILYRTVGIDVYPESIKLLGRSYVPMATEMMQISEAMIDGIMGNTDTSQIGGNIPFVSKFNSFPPRYEQRLYSKRKDILKQSLKEMSEAERSGFEEKYQRYKDQDINKWIKRTKVISKSMKALSKKSDNFKKQYEGEELIKKLKQVEDEEKALLIKFNRMYEEEFNQ